MKCKICQKRMIDIDIEFDYEYNGLIKKAVNVPAFQCLKCNDTIVDDLISARLKAYAMQECNNVIDFAKYEKQEEENFVTLHMLGLM
ncbi:YgiT-type zinc finger protein [Clostridium sp. Marseille-P2415]|uniref:YgiT-type zinc finger protein n=1 Tax=Clostridium sp. Marseille-P2415 TaxID=1805471 RepID=UPI00098878CA|nr:YgiT-type zinc finger protein [Clostridium sp. Marseille-P2415]